MKKQQLLASVSVFRVLSDTDRDIYDVISDFVRGAITKKALKVFSLDECNSLLEEEFSLDIPHAVLSTCLRKRLTKKGELEVKSGTFTITNKFGSNDEFSKTVDEQNFSCEQVISELISHIKVRSNLDINEKKISTEFYNHLLGRAENGYYFEQICRFLLSKESDEKFLKKIKLIEEGLILYEGIRYTPDLATLGNWRGDLRIFLDTEILFSATSLHGLLHEKIFNQFNELIKEANANKRGGNITLHYFEETEKDIDDFFYAATQIIKNKRSVDPAKVAMVSIVNGCVLPSDITIKKSNFLSKLKQLGITKETPQNYYSKPELNVEGIKTLDEIKSNSGVTDTNKIARTLKIFTKINFLRDGVNNIALDEISAIFLTESRFAQSLAFSEIIKSDKINIPFASNVEFLTERLWFKLNKGLGNRSVTPVSFDIITRVKVTLSSHFGHEVSDRFKQIVSEFESGSIDEDTAATAYDQLRRTLVSPEEFNKENIDEQFNLLSTDTIRSASNERSRLEREAREGKLAISRLKEIEHKEHRKKQEWSKLKVRTLSLSLMFLYFIGIPLIITTIAYNLYTPNDTPLAKASFLLAIVPFIARPKTVFKKIKSLCKKYYCKLLAKHKKWSEIESHEWTL
ncbi:hypothetical protein [Ferrimonas sp. SCSIO 43195]|uniref:hypothetical protein n=1 Tax=Ferrimonas sp. SCSIO 43195 TaxID=2822844 RepID=UPI00207520A5|nr:hypothetical protein [Ferrimonas sp. SCSIO 43195]USD36465.1 hypothetical protein J8Z22_15770 [Ferrimonas sp. SCSIO 43195]